MPSTRSRNLRVVQAKGLPRRGEAGDAARPPGDARRTDDKAAEKTERHASRRVVASFWQISATCCSFSAVSAPIFARKYAFCSIFQNLPDYLADFFKIWQILQILRHLQNVC